MGRRQELTSLYYDILDEPLRSTLKKMHEERIKLDEMQDNAFILLPQFRIEKDKRTISLRNRSMFKILQLSATDKRRILRNKKLCTVEYGYNGDHYN